MAKDTEKLKREWERAHPMSCWDCGRPGWTGWPRRVRRRPARASRGGR